MNYLIKENASIKEALIALNSNSHDTLSLLVVDDEFDVSSLKGYRERKREWITAG